MIEFFSAEPPIEQVTFAAGLLIGICFGYFLRWSITGSMTFVPTRKLEQVKNDD